MTAIELAAACQQRWEYEISLREIETQLLEPGSGLRSRTPELVRQELWGLLLAHFAVRALMAQAAAPAGLEHARGMAIREILERVSKGRRKTSYPRVIKKYKGRTFPVKQAADIGHRHEPVLAILHPVLN